MDHLKKLILSVLFLPVILTIDTFRSERGLGKKILIFLAVWVCFGSLWFNGYVNLYNATLSILYYSGITDKMINIPVRGTSMLPTIQDGSKVSLHNPKKFKVTRGDIVSFFNIETEGLHYIKRVIGLSNDQILLKNGQVYINNQPIEEPYIYNNAPTYGNTYLVECQTYSVPKGKVMVFGDNRIASTDSRVIGFIDLKDIDGVIKTGITFSYTDPKSTPPSTPTINSQILADLLNKKRKEKSVTPLRVQNILSSVASTRAKFISQNVNTWKENSALLPQQLTDAKYDYLLFQEIATFGGYNEEQLADHLLELQPYNYDFLSPSYYEMGIGTSTIINDQCQIPVIDIILGWPTKPDISQETIDSWQNEISNISKVITLLNKLQSVPSINQNETRNITNNFSQLLEQANKFKSIASENRWLIKSEIDEQKTYDEQIKASLQKLADYLRTNASNINEPEISQFVSDFKWSNSEFNSESNNAKLLFAQGKFNDLLTSSQKLLTLAKNNDEKAIGYYWQGLAYYSQGQISQAKTSELNAIQNNPQYAAAYSTLSAISFKEQNYNEGLNYAQKCNQYDPKYAWCHNNLAIAYYNLGDKNKGIEEMKIAVSLDSTSYTFNDNLKRMQAGP